MGNELSCCQSTEERESISSIDGRSGSTDATSGLRRRPNPRSSLNEMLRKPSLFKTPDVHEGSSAPSTTTSHHHYSQPSQSSSYSTGDISTTSSPTSWVKNAHKKKTSIMVVVSLQPTNRKPPNTGRAPISVISRSYFLERVNRESRRSLSRCVSYTKVVFP